MKKESQVLSSHETDFFPAEYSVPSSNDNYLKLEAGDNKFRILSKPIIGWLDWQDKKPLRFPMNQKPSKSISPDQPVKHFWAMIVFDYMDNKIKIMEITQKTIQQALENYIKNPDWGAPYNYDITITKKGADMSTEYLTIASPPRKIISEIITAFNAKPIDLPKLFDGADPFAPSEFRTEKELSL